MFAVAPPMCERKFYQHQPQQQAGQQHFPVVPTHPPTWWYAAMRAASSRQSSARCTAPASDALSSTTETAARVGPQISPNMSRSSASLAAEAGQRAAA